MLLPADIVQFSGTWTDEERVVVWRAVLAFEEQCDLPREDLVCTPWMCVASEVGEVVAFAASRLGLEYALHTASAEELAEAIRRLMDRL